MKCLLPITALTLALMTPANAGEWSGYLAGEALLFAEDPIADVQHNSYLSVAFEPEYYHEWNNGKQSFTFTPFQRYDQHDHERTHFDIRELNIISVQETWEIQAGISKEFWGVLESLHLVDIINQTDQVENLDGEDKLGQPMVKFSTVQNWGTIDFFVLPGFRERTFPGKEGRPRLAIPIDDDNPIYESDDEEYHVDFALRWSHYIGDWDVGVAHFHGTSREPVFVPEFNAFGMPVRLLPRYDQIDQTSIDVQATLGSWLWKLEAFTRSGQDDRFFAVGAGFEYTFVGVRDSNLDFGVVVEYLYDERGNTATTPFENDVFTGARLTFNDAQSTEFLGGVTVDTQGGPVSYNVEASRRFGDSWKLSTEIRGVFHSSDTEVQHSFRDDHSIRLELARYF